MRLAFTVLLLVGAGVAGAQNVIPPRDGEFRKSGPGIGCTQVSPAPPSETLTSYQHCLRIGRLQVGIQLHQLQIQLSHDKRIPGEYITQARVLGNTPEGGRSVLMPLAAVPLDNSQARLVSYVVAGYDDAGRVTSVQLTGRPGPITEQLPFSGIRLGAPRQLVIDTLGLPSSVNDVPQIKGKQWNYAPFPFSIELVDGVVYSIRVQLPTPESLQQLFVPLTTLPE